MNLDDYQQNCAILERQPEKILHTRDQADALDSALREGIRFGKLAEALKKHLFRGRNLDLYKLLEVEYKRESPDTHIPLSEVNDDLCKKRLAYVFLGITSELEEIAKQVRQNIFNDESLDEGAILDSAGEIFSCLAILCETLGVPMSEPMGRNQTKLMEQSYDGFFLPKRKSQTKSVEL